MKKITILIILLFATPSFAADVTFTFTNKQMLIANAAAKKIYKGRVTAKQLMKRHLLNALESYRYPLKEIKNGEMTDQEETDLFTDYTQQ